MFLSLFDPDNKFWRFMGKIVDVFLISFLWLLGCIPLITIGASTSALYQFTLRQVDDTESTVLRGYFRAFRQNFGKATLVWMLEVLCGAVLAFDLWACLQMKNTVGNIGFFLFISLSVMYLLVIQYLLPITALFDFPLKKIIGDSFKMALGNLPSTVTCLMSFVLAVWLTSFFWIGFPVFFGLAAFASSYVLRGVLKRYMPEHEEDEEEEEVSDEEEL